MARYGRGCAPWRGGGAVDLSATDNVEPPLREALFSTTQLEAHARTLATEQSLASGRGREVLLRRLACSLAYANPRLRARGTLIARNRKGQSALWAYGISGDRPIVLLRLSDPSSLDMVRLMIQAHAYWRHKGLEVDLVILSEAYAGYRHSLLDAVIGLINIGPEAKALDQPGGIFVRNVAQVPEDDAFLLQAVSRIVLSDRAGTLLDQLDRQMLPEREAPALKPTRKPERPSGAGSPLPHRDLMFFNGWGGFTTDGREYVVVLPTWRSRPGKRPTSSSSSGRPTARARPAPCFRSTAASTGPGACWRRSGNSGNAPWAGSTSRRPTRP